MANSSKHAKAPRAHMVYSSDSFLSGSGTTGTTTESSLHTSDTNYGLRSLLSDTGEENIGRDMTPEETEWLQLAHEFTSAEKPFREQKKSYRVVRKLRTWHPRRDGVTWSFLRRLYNGRQDTKECELAGVPNADGL